MCLCWWLARARIDASWRVWQIDWMFTSPAFSRTHRGSIKDSTIFINPSLGPEGLPLVSLEAMAHGLPCIFSDLPVHREITAGGKAAALFDRVMQSLARQLNRLLDSEQRRQSYALAARQLVEQRYSRSIAAQQYVEAFGL